MSENQPMLLFLDCLENANYSTNFPTAALYQSGHIYSTNNLGRTYYFVSKFDNHGFGFSSGIMFNVISISWRPHLPVFLKLILLTQYFSLQLYKLPVKNLISICNFNKIHSCAQS